jgi:hypothetical protein
MLSHFIKSITALALALTVSAATAAPAGHKCTAKTHRHVKAVAANIAPRGAGLSQQRRSPDIQVLSFGP